MRIEFLTQDDPLYVFPFFEEFVCRYAGEFEITHISSSPPMGNRRRSQMLKELTQLYGAVGMGRLVARLIKSRFLGIIPKQSGAKSYATLAQLCNAYGIPYAKIGNPNASEFVEGIRRRSPDLLVSVACPFILKEPVLSVAPKGAINIHHAPLPRYKGMMPTFWQMYHGERAVGVTIHQMVTKVDEGQILFQDLQAILPGESLDQLIRRTKPHGAHCIAKVIRKIRDHVPVSIPMDKSNGSYFTFPTSGEIREFRKRGLRAI